MQSQQNQNIMRGVSARNRSRPNNYSKYGYNPNYCLDSEVSHIVKSNGFSLQPKRQDNFRDDSVGMRIHQISNYPQQVQIKECMTGKVHPHEQSVNSSHFENQIGSQMKMMDKRNRAMNKRNNYYNYENKNLLSFSVSEREIKEHQDKISNIVKQNDAHYGINRSNGQINSS